MALSLFNMVSPKDPYWDHCFSCCTLLLSAILFKICLSKTELGRLQLIQYTLGHVVANIKRHEQITPTLQSLHWLRIQERITYKIVSWWCPRYSKTIISLQSPYHSASSLRQTFQTHHSLPSCSHIQLNYPEPVVQILGSYTDSETFC